MPFFRVFLGAVVAIAGFAISSDKTAAWPCMFRRCRCGCADAPDLPAPSPTARHAQVDSINRPVGNVDPVPEGCLSMQFFSPSDDSGCKREDSGRISAVITPIGRIEPLQKQWTLADFKKAIYNTDRNSRSSIFLPGAVAWGYLKKYLQSEDQIWTFGVLDTGFVIIRDDNVFCVVVTVHQM